MLGWGGAGGAKDVEEDFFEGGVVLSVGCGDAGAEFFERALGDERALVDDGDVGAEALYDFEHVGREEDGGAALDHPVEHVFEDAGGYGVDAFEGLVQEEDFGAVDDGGGERELLLHAVGEVGDHLFAVGGEGHEVEQVAGALGGGDGVETVHAADEGEVLGRVEAAEEGEAFGDYAYLALELDGVGGEVLAENFDAAGGGGEEAGEHLDGGGFAGAVGSEEAEELALGDGEIDTGDGCEITEAADEGGGLDGGGLLAHGGWRQDTAKCCGGWFYLEGRGGGGEHCR